MPVINSSMYVVIKNGNALIVDPCISVEAKKLLESKNIKNCLILLTHEHFDHISGVNWFKKIFSVTVMCSKKCSELIRHSHTNGASTFAALFLNRTKNEQETVKQLWQPEYSCSAELTYENEIRFFWNDMEILCKEAPGHSKGSSIIKVENKFVFTGDSLIPGEKVITRLPGGSRRLYEANVLPYLRSLDDETIIYPGHGRECRNK